MSGLQRPGALHGKGASVVSAERGGGAWMERHADKIRSPEEAAALVRPGHRVFVGSGAAEPQTLVEALTARTDIGDAEIIHILTLGVAPYVERQLGERFRHNAYFIGRNVRDAVAQGRADYTPIFLSEIPALFRNRRVVLDVAMISVSPPDEHGFCSYGVSTDIVKSGAESARVVIAEVNARMPRALGDSFIHVDRIDALVPTTRDILEAPQGEPSELASRIARHIVDLVEDGSTLQLGIGAIPDAVLGYLDGLKDLGIHTEMFSDGVIPLVQKGVINNAAKTLHPGKIVASFVMGSKALYDFIDDNPLVEFHPSEYTNDPFVIAKNDRMVSINGAIEVDLTGQVCADSLGELFYSGIGGQVDFTRGAARSRGGKPIIALPSTAAGDSISRIVPQLKPGAGVVTSRGDVHYIVTEFGSAYLHGHSIRERAMALIEIAHPKFRSWLVSEARARNLITPEQISIVEDSAPYPEHLEQWIELKDGSRAFMRPLRLTDESRVRDLFYRVSDYSVHHAFFRELKTEPHKKLQEMLRVDYESDMGLVVLESREDHAKMLGIAHYVRDQRSNLGDAAFLVRESWKNRGIGTALMGALTDVAQSNGLAGFTAEVRAEDGGMLRVFHKWGYQVESALVDGRYALTIRFKHAGLETDDRRR
jgi:acyl-CoA hydrolase/GNAT superfamily N-acetyltransferase